MEGKATKKQGDGKKEKNTSLPFAVSSFTKAM